jgi:hypothetical protein
MGIYYLLDPLQTLVAADPQAWLGRIVKNRDCPIEGYTPRGSAKPPPLEVEDSIFLDYAQLEERNATQGFKLAILGDILSTSFERSGSEGQSLKAKQLQRLRLHHDDDVFTKVRSQPDVMADIEMWNLRFRRPLYFIVGLLVATDAVHGVSIQKSHGTSGSVDPGQIALLASGVFLPGGSSIGGNQTRGQVSTTDTVTKNQRIVAFEYRVVKRRGITGDPKKSKLSPYKHKGDRTFGSEEDVESESAPLKIVVELGSETFEEFLEDEEAEFNDDASGSEAEDMGTLDDSNKDNVKPEHGLDRCIVVDL